MEKQKTNLYIGGGLVLIGLLNLLVNMDFIYLEPEFIVATLFLTAASFLFVRFRQKKQLPILIIAAILTFIGSAILLECVFDVDEGVVGVLFLWGLSALFAYGYLRNDRRWGFVIPAGILFTLGLMVLIETMPDFDDEFLGGLFFLGIACTFGYLYVIRDDVNKLDWAKYPALILACFSGFVFLVTTDSGAASVLLPLALILTGGYLVYNATQRKSLERT